MKTNMIKIKKKARCRMLGNERDGYTLTLYNPNDDYKADLQLTREEAELVVNVILKKLK